MADEANGQFGRLGGRHVPCPLEEPLDHFANAFDEIVPTDEFQAEFREALAQWAAGRRRSTTQRPSRGARRRDPLKARAIRGVPLL